MSQSGEETIRRARRHILVLKGGTSLEHDVSMNSGAQVEKHLDRSRYHVHPVTITRTGEWVFDDEPDVFHDIAEALPRLRRMHIDCVFIALHGPRGEDGRIQGLFDMLNIPYVGSGCAASALAMDKVRSKMIAREVGIPLAPDVIFSQAAWDASADAVCEEVHGKLGFPCVVKSPWQGSSLGMGIAQDEDTFRSAVEGCLSYGRVVLVERFISGTEFACSVLDVDEGVEPIGLPITEIRPATKGFFDYHSKYTPGASTEITPAEIGPERTAELQEIAVRAHKAIGCRGFSRSDIIANEDEVVWLEVNTLPGMTGTSLFPQAAAAAGISFSDLVTKLIEAAM